jgi:hypothetical protein
MLSYLLTVVDVENATYIEPEGFRNGSRALVQRQIDQQVPILGQLETILCDKRDLNAAKLHMTRYFPGKELKCFNLIEILQYVPGELKTKKVTKDGVLPDEEASVPF